MAHDYNGVGSVGAHARGEDPDSDDGERVDEEERRRIWRESNIGQIVERVAERRRDLLDRLADD